MLVVRDRSEFFAIGVTDRGSSFSLSSEFFQSVRVLTFGLSFSNQSEFFRSAGLSFIGRGRERTPLGSPVTAGL